jgi:hypothetical protein
VFDHATYLNTDGTRAAPPRQHQATAVKTRANRTYSRQIAEFRQGTRRAKKHSRAVDSGGVEAHALRVNVSRTEPQVRFEQEGTRLTAIEITREQRSPVIAVLQRTLFALGIVVSSYQARARTARLFERIVIERTDGGSIEGALSVATKAAILPIALQQESNLPEIDG